MARIVVCGYMARHPVAGNLLAFFQYVLGFHRLGHEVVYLEESGWPYSCYDPDTQHWVDHPVTGLKIVREMIDSLCVRIPVVYVNRDTGHVDGASWDEVNERLRQADLLVNVGGVCELPMFQQCRRRAIVDMDPLFTQVEMFGARTLNSYHVHFSYGANIGRKGCTIPTCGIEWVPIVPPIVLDLWQWAEPAADAPFTTIANWGSYGSVVYQGTTYGQKDEEFLRLIDLPRHSARRLELSLSGGHERRTILQDAGWSIRDAGDELGTNVQAYRDYIRTSYGEFSVAKNAYVISRSGWFSDRGACYLAAGLPVVLQETGFSDWLPHGAGVLAYGTLEEAASCLEQVTLDYQVHRRAARRIAESVFAHDRVLPRLLDRAMV